MLKQIKKPINIVLLFILFFELLYFVTAVYAEDSDTNLTDLNVLGSAACDDDTILYVVDDPNGTPLPRYIGRHEFLLGWTGSTNLDTFAADSVNDTHIDWGSGANQVDLADIPGGVAGANAFDFGGATSLELPNGTDVDVDAAGEVSIDTDGANEPNDVTLRTASASGNQQYALANALKSIQATIISPQDLDDSTRDACPIWENNTGMSFIITMIRAWSDTDDTSVNVETYDSDWDNNATVDALEIATDATANYYVEETTITAATIAAGSLIVLDFDDTDDPGWVHVNIMGYFDANVD